MFYYLLFLAMWREYKKFGFFNLTLLSVGTCLCLLLFPIDEFSKDEGLVFGRSGSEMIIRTADLSRSISLGDGRSADTIPQLELILLVRRSLVLIRSWAEGSTHLKLPGDVILLSGPSPE